MHIHWFEKKKTKKKFVQSCGKKNSDQVQIFYINFNLDFSPLTDCLNIQPCSHFFFIFILRHRLKKQLRENSDTVCTAMGKNYGSVLTHEHCFILMSKVLIPAVARAII